MMSGTLAISSPQDCEIEATISAGSFVNISTAHTRNITRKYNHTWKIDNFMLIQKNNLRSPPFPSSEEPDDLKWCLILHPGGTISNPEYLSINLCILSLGKIENKSVHGSFELSLLDNEHEVVTATKKVANFTFKSTVFPESSAGYKKLILKKMLLEKADILLPNDQLIINCKIHALTENISTLTENVNTLADVIVPKCQLVQHYQSLLSSEKFSDVTFNVKGSMVKAHKAILTAQSPVFCAMFDHDMKESKDNQVEIPDIELEVFQEMLNFIYTGQTPMIDEMSDQLLVAADKYCLERLKGLCEQNLCKKMKVDNTAEILVLSNLHSAKQLKSYVYNFIRLHITQVVKSESWKEYSDEYPQFFLEVLQACATHNSCDPPMKKAKI